MRILILNWRDFKNPKSGGAEILTHEMAKRWTKWGHGVTQISSGFKNSKNKENIDGVTIIRIGHWWSVHLLGFLYYLKNLKSSTDVIIDEVHWFPFFSTLYAPKKTILLACEVANKLFFEFFPYPLAFIGRGIEKLYLALYKNVPVLAISSSTKKELVAEGFSENKITVLPMGINFPKIFPKFKKEKNPTIIFVGRILKTKGVEDVIKVCLELKKEFANIKLWIVGRGEKKYEQKIKKQIRDLNLDNQVDFFGFVSEEKKFGMMQRAHMLIVPSIKEGYGLTIPEAGIVGTPAVAYNTEGLRDVLKNGKNGILVDCNPRIMAEEVKQLLLQKNLYKNLQEGAESYARQLNWDKTAKVGLDLFKRLTSPVK